MTIAKSINKTLDISVEDVRIDLTATIRSYDLTDTQFIFEIKSSNGMTVNLTGSTAMYIVEYVHNSQTYAIQGNVDIIGNDTLSFNLPEGLKGYSGTVLIGIYVKLTDGTKIDIKDIAVRIEPSIMDKDIDFSAKTYFKDFEKVKAEVILEGEKAKTDIKQVLPSVKAEISEIKTEIENLPDIPDLFVAYADDLSGTGFSKTDTTKLYKGYGVKNSNLPSDYRWERNVDRLIINGRNLLLNSGREVTNKDYVVNSYHISPSEGSVLSNGNGYLVEGKKYTIVACITTDSTMNEIRLFLSGGYQGLGGINLEKNKKQVVSFDFTARYYEGKYPSDDVEHAKLYLIRNSSPVGLADVQYVTVHWVKVVDASGVVVKDWSPAPEDVELQSNPINSILTTLSQENPSTTIGGTWTQLGTEQKFSQTIYYWQRTN